MPWKPKDAKKHTDKAHGKKLARVWAQVANDTRQREIDHGTPEDKAEAIAIRSANAVVARVMGKGKRQAAVDAQLIGHNGSVGAGDGPVFAGDAADFQAAVWSTAEVNELPDSAFLYVESGKKDGDGKTTPRSKRHFPYRNKSGAIDLPHLRNAIAQAPKAKLPPAAIAAVQKKARKLLKKHGGKKLAAEAGDQANLVENEFLPKIGEHWARVAEPETFNHLSINACDVEAGVRCIQGTLKDGDETQKPLAYHFDKKVFPSIGDVQRWLGKRGLQATKLEPAKDVQYPKMTCEGGDIRFDAAGEVTFRAVSAAAEHRDNLPTIDILAYNGGPLSVKGYDLPVVVDIATLQTDPEQTPVIADHVGANRVGHAQAIKSANNLRLKGVVSCVTDAAREVVASVKNGFKYQASIGCQMRDASFEYYAPGETLEANGQRFSGPLYFARNAKLAECSLLTTGADDRTQVSIAAGADVAAAHPTKGMFPMPKIVVPGGAADSATKKPKFKKWLKANGHDVAALTPEKRAELRATFDAELQAAAPATPAAAAPGPEALAVRGDVVTETRRIQAIRKMTADLLAGYGGHADGKTIEAVQKIELEAISGGWDSRDAEIRLLRMARPVGPAVHIHQQQPLQAEVLEAAACEHLRMADVEKQFRPEILEASHKRFKGRISLQQMMLEAAWANGCDVRYISGDADLRRVMNYACPGHVCPGGDLIAADASTISLPNLFSNLANKALLEGFWAVESVWRDVASVGSSKDFKPNPHMRFYGNMAFQSLSAAGEIKHGSVGEVRYDNQVDLRAEMFSTTYKDIINDDLSALSQVPRLLGRGAAVDLNHGFWTEWLSGLDSQGVAMFSTARNNLVAGNYNDDAGETQSYGLTAISGVQTLTAMKQAFLQQKAPDGEPVAIAPSILLAPPKRADFAKRLVQSSELRSTLSGATYPIDNPHAGLFKLAISSYLAEAYAYTGADDSACWLLADPAVLAAVEVLFLQGQQTPTVQSSDADFGTLGFQHRGWWAWGVANQEYRAAVKATSNAS